MSTTPTLQSDTQTEPLPLTTLIKIESNNLTNAADGDATGAASATVAGNATGVGAPTSPDSPSNSSTNSLVTKTVTTASSNSEVPEMVVTAQRPGKRLKNPLAAFSSYTYQLTLYQVTPEAHIKFVSSGKQSISALPAGHIVTLAQSGGINNASQKRAAGFELDFYIDDLTFKTTANPKATSSAANLMELGFTIYEPYGFSFLSKLRQATLALMANSKVKNANSASNAVKQIYILGVRFQGYDKDGNIATASTTFSKDTANTDPNASGVFERFYDISLKKIGFKLDGKMSTYKINAVSYSTQVAMGVKYGRINNGLNLDGTTVNDVLNGPNGLMAKLNAEQIALAKTVNPDGKTSIEIPNEYSVRFDGDSADLKNAIIVSKAEIEKFKLPMSTAKTTAQVNEKTAAKSNPDDTKKTITFKNDTPIIQAFNNIISQSSYIGDALKILTTDALEPNNPNDPNQIKNPRKKTVIQWYNVGAEVECKGWDNTLGDWAYKITYVLQPYSTPASLSSYTPTSSEYPGASKRYDYWYTGQNSEIIGYEQTLDNSYYMVALAPATIDAAQQAGISQKANARNNEDRTGSPNTGKEANNSYLASLYSPGDWARAKITILGDPDFLMRDTPMGVNDTYNKYYAPDGFTINPGGSHMFIEINFNEGSDYKHTDGLLSLSDSVTFWQNPNKSTAPGESKVKGVSYMVILVQSNFKDGKFSQVLECVLNPVPTTTNPATAAAAGRDPTQASATLTRQSTQQAGDSTNTTSPTQSSSASGLLIDPSSIPTSESAAQQNANQPTIVSSTSETSPTGGSNIIGPNLVTDAFDPFAGTASSTAIAQRTVQDDENTISSVNNAIIAAASNSNNDDGGRELTT